MGALGPLFDATCLGLQPKQPDPRNDTNHTNKFVLIRVVWWIVLNQKSDA